MSREELKEAYYIKYNKYLPKSYLELKAELLEGLAILEVDKQLENLFILKKGK